MTGVAGPDLDDDAAGGRLAARSLPEQVADACGRLIVEGRLRAGERLTEQEAADRFGVSRGPVREAFRLLERRRLVELIPRKGARVRPLSLQTVADLFDVRIALSGLAARTMASRGAAGRGWLDTLDRRVAEMEAMATDPEADPRRFALAMTRAVRTVARGSGNDLLVQMFEDLDDQTVWPILWRAPLDGIDCAVRSARAAGMRATAAQIAAGDPDGAEVALRAVYGEIRAAALEALARQAPEGLRPRTAVSPTA